ncbi:ECI2 [Bugula neritina]|uniref:ECI2 n=1 Tax=Bugula neritina TaxID=10212 RepID=A0A7J7JKP3_BUGNE|nr:ECI2 [Bugula neritina]
MALRVGSKIFRSSSQLYKYTGTLAATLRGHLQSQSQIGPLHTSPYLRGAHDAEFNKAKERLSQLKEDPGNQVKLQIYALFKQSTIGANTTKKPGMMDFVGKAKWDAWTALGSLSQDDAQLKYIELINSLVSSDSSADSADPATSGKYTTLDVTNQNGVCKIQLNRPKKKNAITIDMYNEWAAALAEADKDPSVVLAVVTGAGDYYCSGNDLNNFMGVKPENMSKMAQDSSVLLQNFVDAFINFSKPLIGVVNGPAVGVAVTTMGLFDLVYATDKATFHTPFSSLGQSPEGCSSYTFPKILGPMKAAEMLLFNKKISAAEACKLGLVTEVFPDQSFQTEVWERINSYAKFPKGGYGLTLPEITLRQMPKFSFIPNSSFIRQFTPVYYVYTYSFFIQFLVFALVQEKQTRLKETLRIMGMRDAAFW